MVIYEKCFFNPNLKLVRLVFKISKSNPYYNQLKYTIDKKSL